MRLCSAIYSVILHCGLIAITIRALQESTLALDLGMCRAQVIAWYWPPVLASTLIAVVVAMYHEFAEVSQYLLLSVLDAAAAISY